MYENYWGLSSPPFANRLVAHGFYESPVHEEALARLLYCVEQDKSLAILHGPSGCGKSQLLKVLADQVRRTQRFFAEIDLANLGEGEFLRELEDQFRLGGTDADSSGQRWRRLRDFFESAQESRIQTVLVAENLERAEDSAVQAIRRLIGLHHQSLARLTVIAGLNHGKFSQSVKALFELADLGIEVRPLERGETESYVQKRLEVSGSRKRVFQAEALDQLHQLTGGVPREINRLCDLALLAGMNESRTAIDSRLITNLSAEHRLP